MSFPFQCLLLLLLLLCFFLHACNSRPLGLLHKESGKQVHFGPKEHEGKESHQEISIRLKHRRRSIYKELLPEEIHMAKFGGKKPPESLVGANKMELEAIDLEQENINNKGIDHNKVPSSLEVSQEITKEKGWKTLARSTMESKKHDDTDENVKSDEEKGTVEDVVVMDYAQPHRKPPIHNLEH